MRNILVVVDSKRLQGAALARAAALSQRTGARLQVLMPVFELSIHASAELVDTEVQRLARQQYLDEHEAILAPCVAQLQAQGLDAGGEVVWSRKPYEAVIVRALDLGADLVVAELVRESFLRRWSAVRTAEWRLARFCPVPLMLVQEGAAPLPRRVTAAVDPVHPQARAGELDDRVLEQARALATLSGASLDVAHVFAYAPHARARSAKMKQWIDALREEDAAACMRFAQRHGIAPDAIARLEGEPVEALVQHCGDPGDLLVIGSQYRRGMDRMLLGSHAEPLISQAGCDLLLVRPDGLAADLEPEFIEYRGRFEADTLA